ncbi:MAG: sigma-70 family RNA polymerase sigma factor [Candidatus Aminicenantales bacterium]|jgi:RNA polymerase sigma-70 factor (ECF subfamily)
MDEHQLIALVKDGDQSAFAQIVSAYKDKIVNFLYQLTGDYQRAVDLSQETFLRVYFKADKYRPIAPLSAWIYAIAANLAKTDIKKRKRMALVSLEDLPPTVTISTPSGDASDSGLSANLKEALAALNPRYRIPILLKDIEGYSQEEIARIINRPVGTVKARISRGRAMLKVKLERARRDANPLAKTEMLDERY